jgi:hypothetical protein
MDSSRDFSSIHIINFVIILCSILLVDFVSAVQKHFAKTSFIYYSAQMSLILKLMPATCNYMHHLLNVDLLTQHNSSSSSWLELQYRQRRIIYIHGIKASISNQRSILYKAQDDGRIGRQRRKEVGRNN